MIFNVLGGEAVIGKPHKKSKAEPCWSFVF
jgi:hypothetical protein